MTKFSLKKSGDLPAISTASLPDIVFILLFFFMTVTTISPDNPFVEQELPKANEVDKLQDRDRVIEIWVGRPKAAQSELLGRGHRVQLGGKFAEIAEIGPYVLEEMGHMPEALRKKARVSLKADRETPMGLIQDIKTELRRVPLLNIQYTTVTGDVFENPR